MRFLTCMLTSLIGSPSYSHELPTVQSELTLFEQVARCWNVGSLSTEALAAKVTVHFHLNEQDEVISNSIVLDSASGASELAVAQAFEAARRAIIRCGAVGFELSPGHPKELFIEFSPEEMRTR